ncbi:MAG: rod shape-determining protein [Clostridia bacterium]|nr:rod shape-determining protein [Clostridia bacterium]MBQ9505971.1 rod shape-determining protein [Clostridia bacterium]
MLFSQDIGIDLGTANTLICVKHKGIVIREPSVVAVAVGAGQKKVVAVGEEAKKMIGRTPGSITAVRPIKDGVIADFQMTADMLRHFIKKAMGSSPFARARVMICIPSGVTEVERKAVHDAAVSAGARYVSLIEEPMAAAIGAGIDVTAPRGSMVVDIGGGTTEVAVISLGDIVCSRSLRVAGDMFDDAIVQFVRKKYSVLIGERTAEEIKISLGSAVPYDGEGALDIRGRNLIDGLPKNVEVTSEDIREALEDPIAQIVETVRTTIEKTPPELAADILDSGIVLTGGGALIRGLDKLISAKTGMPCRVAEAPIDCVVTGTAICLEKDTLNIGKGK